MPFASRDSTTLLALVALAATATLACESAQNALIERVAGRMQQVDRSDWQGDGALHVVLCGTGSPLPDPNRAAACTAVVAGDAMYVVDTGPGSSERLQLDRMPLGALRGVLLTHFHSDHIGELGELNLQSWAGGGRSEPLAVYGPPGVERVVDGFLMAYALDSEYRVAHHGAEIVPPRGAEMLAMTIELPEDGSAVTVLDEGGLQIRAALVDHAPVVPAVAYRFDYAGRSVVVSGDTVASANLARLAKGADLLVHEVLVGEVMKIISEAAYANDRPRIGKIATDVIDYHTSPGDAVELAKQAQVDTIVFSHRVPPLPGFLAGSVFMRGVDDGGEVEVVLGEDGMHFRMPADGDAIELESL
jgi:ribonuclease Z